MMGQGGARETELILTQVERLQATRQHNNNSRVTWYRLRFVTSLTVNLQMAWGLGSRARSSVTTVGATTGAKAQSESLRG